MTKVNSFSLLAFALLAPFVLSNCASKIDVHGKYITEEQVKQIKLSEHHKSDVEELLGSPSIEGPFESNVWYYLGRKTSQRSFLNPVLIDFKGFGIHFNHDGYVDRVVNITQEDLVTITPARRYTPSTGHQMTFWEQMGSYAKRGAPERKK